MNEWNSLKPDTEIHKFVDELCMKYGFMRFVYHPGTWPDGFMRFVYHPGTWPDIHDKIAGWVNEKFETPKRFYVGILKDNRIQCLIRHANFDKKDIYLDLADPNSITNLETFCREASLDGI